MSRIQLTDTTQDAVVKMSDGNLGAINVMCALIKETPKYDPECAMGGLMKVLALDTLGIYGARIWIFCKDVCHGNIDVMIGLLRAHQLGHLSEHDLNAAIDGHKTLDVISLIGLVQKELPSLVMTTDPATIA